MTELEKEKNREFYHEKQILGHCAIHSLNNLFQSRWISYDDLVHIAQELHQADQSAGLASICSFNPYRSQIPFHGYFDISCIVKALSYKDCELTEHILTTKDVISLDISSSQIIGLIINEKNPSFFCNFWESRHWYSILFDHENLSFVNLDSNFDDPLHFSGEAELKNFLNEGIRLKQSQIFVVSRICRIS